MAIAALDFERNLRNSVALSHLAASRDHGSSVLTLLEIQLDAHDASALSLIRMQLDTLLRACFFAKEATDGEIEYFLAKDEMPKRRKEIGPSKWQSVRLSPNDLAPFAKSYLGLDSADNRLENSVKSTWRGLHGMVHGGRATLNQYDAGREIRFTLSDDGFDFALKQSTTFIQLCGAAFIRMAKQNEDEKNRASLDVIDAWIKFSQVCDAGAQD